METNKANDRMKDDYLDEAYDRMKDDEKEFNFDGEGEKKASQGDYGNAFRKEFNLSNYLITKEMQDIESMAKRTFLLYEEFGLIPANYVKEFIRLLKKEFEDLVNRWELHTTLRINLTGEMTKIIDKLAGKKLI